MTAIVRGGKWSPLETHSLSIALLDWTIKQKRQNRNMGYVCIFALLSVKCEASHNNIVKLDFLCSKSWHRANRDCKIINNAFILETLSSDKIKEAVCRILRFWFIMKI